jgi:predicted methyltransferase
MTIATVAALGGLFAAATLSSVALRDGSERDAPAIHADQGAGDAAPAGAAPAPDAPEQQQLFRPEDLVLLEMPDREMWQQPELIMTALNIADGDTVADVGAGAGWFTIRLAERVGPQGTVYAHDLQHQMVTAIARRVQRENLQRPPENRLHVRVVQGQEHSPNLPPQALDAALVVDVYPEIDAHDRVMFLQSLAEALRPRGRIGIVNYKPGGGGPGPLPERRVPRELVEADALLAGLTVLDHIDLKYQYLVVIGLPAPRK